MSNLLDGQLRYTSPIEERTLVLDYTWNWNLKQAYVGHSDSAPPWCKRCVFHQENPVLQALV